MSNLIAYNKCPAHAALSGHIKLKSHGGRSTDIDAVISKWSLKVKTFSELSNGKAGSA